MNPKPTQAQLAKTLAITVNGTTHRVQYTTRNGAHIVERDTNDHRQPYVLAFFRREWVVWAVMPDGSTEWGRYFSEADHATAYSRFLDLTYRARAAARRAARTA
jgi:hypothetical protein